MDQNRTDIINNDPSIPTPRKRTPSLGLAGKTAAIP